MDLTDRDKERLRRAYEQARGALKAERRPEGHWVGELSASALATATAVGALSMAGRERFADLIASGLAWLTRNQNDDGGWGDTPDSPSNVPTTLLSAAAFALGRPKGQGDEPPLSRAERYLHWHAGETPAARVETVCSLYGADRTFAVPILMTCALASERGPSGAAALVRVDWADVPPLPFELALLPRAAFRWLRLHVVSYALPALIAIGQLLHQRCPARNPFLRALRHGSVNATLRRLEAIQPASGGFLEAVPLTSFVVMALAGAERGEHPVARRGAEFLEEAARPDGGWAIDMDLSTWVTTLSVQALTTGGRSMPQAETTAQWLREHQHTARHPYTDAPPGGWAWTHRSGGVPDADDTAGALLALAEADPAGAAKAAERGLQWLLGLQNRNGGWPTFCRGWGRLPFDRSAPDLTAHALRALAAWPRQVEQRKRGRATARGLAYLRRTQHRDGAWLPLWFGNQSAPNHENPVYGTARVLLAYRDLGLRQEGPPRRGVRFLLDTQAADGGWGGNADVEPTVEETALAVQALAAWDEDAACAESCARGARWLAARIEAGGLQRPAPIGLYFARLWYSERLYPIILSVGALASLLPAHPKDAPP